MSFTYDVTTSRGKVRLLAFDTDSTNYVFEDAEVDALLSLEGQSVYRAAACALRSIAAEKSRLAAVVRLSSHLGIERTKMPEHLMNLADKYETKAAEEAPLEYVEGFDDALNRFGEVHDRLIGAEDL